MCSCSPNTKYNARENPHLHAFHYFFAIGLNAVYLHKIQLSSPGRAWAEHWLCWWETPFVRTWCKLLRYVFTLLCHLENDLSRWLCHIMMDIGLNRFSMLGNQKIQTPISCYWLVRSIFMAPYLLSNLGDVFLNARAFLPGLVPAALQGTLSRRWSTSYCSVDFFRCSFMRRWLPISICIECSHCTPCRYK